MTGQATVPPDAPATEAPSEEAADRPARATRPAAGAADHHRARGDRGRLLDPQVQQLPDGVQHPRDRDQHGHPRGPGRRDDIRHHHRRHRPVGGQRPGLQRRRRRQGDGGPGRPGLGDRPHRRPGRHRLRARLGAAQRRPDRTGEGAAAHRHARHPGHGPRPGRGDHRRRGPARCPDRHGQRRGIRQHLLAGPHPGRDRRGHHRDRDGAAAPDQVRVAYLRDRIKPGGGPAFRHQRQRPPDQGLRPVRPVGRLRRAGSTWRSSSRPRSAGRARRTSA